ncbi:MAG TPA: mercury resistance system transport protein MerF [Kiloniellales bacterium]|jgi:mercuric ion transport protein
MTDKSILKIGVVGTIVTAVCCFTPLLVVLLGVIGLSSLIGRLDVVLLPALAMFMLLTGYGLWKRRRKA